MTETSSKTANLPLVRRLEAVGFRAWPASSVQYDGSWQVRLTAGHPSNRLNSIVPLDPSDHRDIEIRLEKASRKFEAYGRPAVLRQTPLGRLGSPQDTAHLVEFLCSPQGQWINGQLLMSNGGLT